MDNRSTASIKYALERPGIHVHVDGEAQAVSKLWNAFAEAAATFGGSLEIDDESSPTVAKGVAHFPTLEAKGMFNSAPRPFLRPFRWQRMNTNHGIFEIHDVRIAP